MSAPTRRVLVVDDQPQIPRLVELLLGDGFHITPAASAVEALARMEDTPYDAVLADLAMPEIDGIELIRRARRRDPDTPIVVLAGAASVETAVAAMREGAFDYLRKTASAQELRAAVERAVTHGQLQREVRRLRDEVERARGVHDIIGQSPAMRRLLSLTERIAPSEAVVLILGESGTGKELLARTIHRLSLRREQPFVAFDSSALAPSLIESELFGHAKGAFTDAKAAKPGLFEEADGGTLFLDEIGDMDLTMQSRLLRVLEDGRVRRVGETRDRQVDVRVLAATHRNLEEEVKAGRFRDDLYFRLAHLPIPVPSLRERREDISLLFNHFLEHFSRQHRTRPRQADPELLPYLERYAWPGNVRELRNLCERLVVFGADPLTPDQLPSSFFEPANAPETGLLLASTALPIVPLRDFKAQCEREYIESVLRRVRWNFTAAARVLDVQRTYLHQKVKVLGIRRPGAEIEEEAEAG
jgi:DNA-binding NtrC family response regulator